MCNKSNLSTPSELALIKFLYKETSPEEREAIVPAIFSNPPLEEEFNELLDLKRELDEVVFAPSDKCVSNIMAFAKQAIGKH